MKEKLIKGSLLLLFLFIILFAAVFTYLNVFKYGSVLKITLPFYSFAIIIPIYSSLINKIFRLRMFVFLYSIFIIIVSVFIYKLPDYTYEEAVVNMESKLGMTSSDINIKHTKEASLFYVGNYKMKFGDTSYSYSLKDHIIKELEGK